MGKPVIMFAVKYLIIVIITICTTIADEKGQNIIQNHSLSSSTHARNSMATNENGTHIFYYNETSSNISDTFNETQVTKDSHSSSLNKTFAVTFFNETILNQTSVSENKIGSATVQGSVTTVDKNVTTVSKIESFTNEDGDATVRQTVLTKTNNRTTVYQTNVFGNKDGTATIEEIITVTNDDKIVINQTGTTTNKHDVSNLDPVFTVQIDNQTTVYKTDVTKDKDGAITVDQVVTITNRDGDTVHHTVKHEDANGNITVLTNTFTANGTTIDCNAISSELDKTPCKNRL